MLRSALVMLACGALLGLAGTTAPVHAAQADTQASEFTLLFHGSVQGEITDCGCKKKPLGGLARRAALIELARADCGADACCLLVDAGNLLGPADDERESQNAFLVEETSKLGYAAVGVGAWDLRHGVESLRAAEKKGIRYTNANLIDATNGEPAFAPYRVATVKGVRVGLISVASAEGLSGVEMDGLELRSPREALQRTLPELREACDLVVLLAQMQTSELRQLLLDLQENPLTVVEIAIEGTGSRRYSRPNQVGDSWLLAANNRGKVLGKADLIVAEGGELLDLDLEIQELKLDLPEEPGVAQRVREFQEAHLEVAGTR